MLVKPLKAFSSHLIDASYPSTLPLTRATRRSLPRLNSPDTQIPTTAAAMNPFRTIPNDDDIHNSQVKR